MIIKKTSKTTPIEIDLTGPDGNAFALMGKVKGLLGIQGRELSERDGIIKRMMESDYENLLRVFDEEFGEIVVMLR